MQIDKKKEYPKTILMIISKYTVCSILYFLHTSANTSIDSFFL